MPASLPPFLPRVGWAPALLGQPGGPLGMGHWGRVTNTIQEKLWLPISGQLNRRLSLSPLMFEVFVAPQTSMAAVHLHTGCTLHGSRRRPSHEQDVSGAQSAGFFHPRVFQPSVILTTFVDFSLATYPCSTKTSFFVLAHIFFT